MAHVKETEPRRGTLLGRRRFLPLLITQFLGAFNDNVYKNALIIFITFGAAQIAREDSAATVTLATGLFILPFFIFSAIAGQCADKFEKSGLIRKVKVAEIVIMSLAAIGFWSGNVWFLIFVLFLMGTQSAMFGPVKYAILPQHLEVHELVQGNGLIQMATFLAILLGTVMGGVVVNIDAVGLQLISFLVVCFALAGWLSSRWIPEAEPADPHLVLEWNVFSHTRRIVGYARESRIVFVSIIAISWFWFIGATYLQLLPSYTRDVLGGDAQVVTALLTAFSVGIGLGSVLCGRLSIGRIELGLIPIGAFGLALFSIGVFFSGAHSDAGEGSLTTIDAFFVVPGNWLVTFNLLLVAFSGGLYIVPLFSLVQQRARAQRRAQIIAANNIVNALMMVMSAIITIGMLKVGFSPDEIILSVGLASIVVASCLLVAMPESRRSFIRWFRSHSSTA